MNRAAVVSCSVDPDRTPPPILHTGARAWSWLLCAGDTTERCALRFVGLFHTDSLVCVKGLGSTDGSAGGSVQRVFYQNWEQLYAKIGCFRESSCAVVNLFSGCIEEVAAMGWS